MGGDDLDVGLLAGAGAGGEAGRSTVVPRGGKLKADISQLNPTVGEVEDVVRCLCQDGL